MIYTIFLNTLSQHSKINRYKKYNPIFWLLLKPLGYLATEGSHSPLAPTVASSCGSKWCQFLGQPAPAPLLPISSQDLLNLFSLMVEKYFSVLISLLRIRKIKAQEGSVLKTKKAARKSLFLHRSEEQHTKGNYFQGI